MTATDWINALGGAATFGVALVVYLANKAASERAHQLAARSAAVEDQKFRLALLDRREKALNHVRTAIGAFWQKGRWEGENAQQLGDALRIAELVFEDEQRDRIERLLVQLFEWQSADRRQNAYRDRDGEQNQRRFQLACDEGERIEQAMLAEFDPLLSNLKQATRIRSVAPLADTVGRFQLPRRDWA